VTLRVDAIVLAGGRATRMGGVDKPAITVGGATMLATVLAAAGECDHRVVVGPPRADLPPDIAQTRERPAGSGPVAAVAAGLRALGPDAAEIIVVLAADLPLLRADTVRELVRRCRAGDRDVACATDATGRAQYLVAAWRHDALAARLAALGSPADQPMKALVPDDVLLVALDGVADCDTDDDVARVSASLNDTALALDTARDALRGKLSRLPAHILPIADCADGALAEPVHAADAVPRFDAAAMDGYAVAGNGPWALRGDTSFAGGATPAKLRPGAAVRIATGARMPDGASAVLRDEFAVLDGARLSRRAGSPHRTDLRERGEDWRIGDLLAPAGAAVGAALLSLAASTGVGNARVRGPVRAAALITGDEICGGEPTSAGQTRDALGPVLPSFLAHCGLRCVGVDYLTDTAANFDDIIAGAAAVEVLVVVGATGGGAADHLRAALERAGAGMVVPRLRMRPGGSTVVAALADGRVVLGLPGNPFAAVAVLLALTPALVDGLLARSPRARARTGRLANAHAVSGPVTRVLPALALPDDTWLADAAVRTAHLGGLLGRDALAVIPPNAPDHALVELLPLP
jgi:molybdopterin biosynthesis enzyme/molybdopterin-guanine dinucleotide biosynthesis protein A